MEADAMNEAILRPVVFLGVLVVMLIAEGLMPHHHDPMRSTRRWGNSLLFLTGMVLGRLIAPMGALGIAAFVNAKGWGILPHLPFDGTLLIVLSVVLLDLAIWAQHVVFHKVDWLWRLHRVHHADPHLDVTSGFRFHPLEIALSLFIKGMVIALLGAPTIAVFLFEVLLNASSMITHANIRLPERLDHAIRFLFVTPAMHRVHHSVERVETDSNYGFMLAIWDRIFGSYCPHPARGDTDLAMGIDRFRSDNEQRIVKLLTQPFREQ